MDAARRDRHAKETYTINGREVRLTMAAPDQAGPADLVLVGLKYPDLRPALDTVAAVVGEDTVLLSLMNGVDSEDILRTLDPEALPSMGQDRRQKRRSEVDMFAGVVIRCGEELGIETPVNRFLLRRVREIEGTFS